MASTARNRGIGRQAITLLSLLSACALVALQVTAARASEVIDVRIGAHPGFTRIVFELDTSAGYRVERSSPQSGVSEVVVTIDATSIPRELLSSKSLVNSVRIVPQGASSVAQIRLVKDGLRLKQMILASPPRIVLDVLAPALAEPAESKKPAPTRTAAAKPEPKPKPAAPPAPPPTPKPTAAAPPAPAPAVARPTPPAPAPAPVVAKPAEPGLDEKEDVLADAVRSPSPAPPAAAPISIPTPVPTTTPLAAKPPSGAVAPPPSGGSMRPGSASPARSLPLAPVAEEKGMGMGTLGGLLALLALAAIVVLVVLRRRSAAAGSDAGEFDAAAGAGSDNPFAGLGYKDDGQPVFGAGGARAVPAEDADEEEESPFAGLGEVTVPPVDEVDGVDQVDEQPAGAPPMRTAVMELGGEDMDVQTIGRGAGASSGSGTGRTEVAGGPAGSDEVTRMMREFERRIASLETRLDEVVDARERLDRQVAAQTEELRVQRAAIARTQRAVRNLTRGDEDVATEPASRDPERPRSGD